MVIGGVVARIAAGPHDAHPHSSHLPMRYDAGRPRAVIQFRISQPRTASLPCPAGLRAQPTLPGNLVLQRQECLAIGFVDLVNHRYVGMAQRSRGLGFAVEALASVFVLEQVGGEELEGDVAVKFRVLGLVNVSHFPGAKLLRDLVVTDGLADHDGPILPPPGIPGDNNRSHSLSAKIFASRLMGLNLGPLDDGLRSC